jgi:hypothetical protein
MRLVVCGDSWAWGAELLDPITGERWGVNDVGHSHHFIPVHEAYRLKHKYPILLAEKLGATNVVDLSFCSISNDYIFRTLMDWLATEGYLQGRDTSELLISIGWTSPERTEFYYQDRWGDTNWAPFGPWQLDLAYAPHGDKDPNKDDLFEFFRLYFDYFMHKTEFMHRYARQVWMMQFILKKLNIRYVMHQAFYHEHSLACHEWNDVNYWDKNKLSPIDKFFWDDVDKNTFIFKDDTRFRTFQGYIKYRGTLKNETVLELFHPNVRGHELWAEKLYMYIKDNIL